MLTRLIHHGCTAPVTTAWAIAFETGASPFVIYQSIEILALLVSALRRHGRRAGWVSGFETMRQDGSCSTSFLAVLAMPSI